VLNGSVFLRAADGGFSGCVRDFTLTDRHSSSPTTLLQMQHELGTSARKMVLFLLCGRRREVCLCGKRGRVLQLSARDYPGPPPKAPLQVQHETGNAAVSPAQRGRCIHGLGRFMTKE
jgi:hypothetical protein